MDGNKLEYGVKGGGQTLKVDMNIKTISADVVLPGLWIGNQAASQSKDFMKQHGIKTVFNATKHLPFVPNMVEIRIPVNDPGPFNGIDQADVARMYRALPCAVDMLHDALKKGGVLVHCHAGMQRSAALVTAYLAKYYFSKLDTDKDKTAKADLFEKSRKFLYEKRNKVFYNGWYVNFEKAIKKYIKDGMPDADVKRCVR
jgi:hypothetical protein